MEMTQEQIDKVREEGSEAFQNLYSAIGLSTELSVLVGDNPNWYTDYQLEKAEDVFIKTVTEILKRG